MLCRLIHIEARRNKPLIQRLFNGFTYAQNLARGLHFRPELRVYVVQLFKRKHRHLYGNVRRIRIKPRAVAQLFQLCARKNLCCQINHGHARDLGYIGNCPRRSGIYLYNVKLVMVNEVLNIDKPLCL